MALVIDSVTKTFGSVRALDGISFRVERGQVFGFLGANGAGKTTAMRIVLDILRPDSGTVTWLDQPSTSLPRRTWGYLPEERGLYARMQVLDQLVFFAGLYGVPARDARRTALEWLERFRVPEYAGRRAEELSKGNQQKIQFIAATIHDPEVLIMDEPFTGLDPVNVALLKDAFLEMARRGKTLIFSTHQMETVEELCEAIAIIDRGRVIVGGALAEVKRASGRRVVRLALDGDAVGEPGADARLGWLTALPGVSVSRSGRDYTEIAIDLDTDPEAILRAVQSRGLRVRRFEITDPSLEEIFVSHVGRNPSAEERHLAGEPTGHRPARTEPGSAT